MTDASRIASLLLAFVIGTAVCHAAPTAPAAPAGGEAIRLDGVLDEAAWVKTPWQTGFVNASKAASGAPAPAAVQTRFKALYDEGALYLGIECDEPHLDGLKAEVTEHDGMVWGDDCIEVFFDPAGEGRYFHHLIFNSKGVWFDEYAADYGLVHAKSWDCPLQVGAKVDAAAKVWRLEIKLPFAALKLNTDARPDWLFNICRERYAGGDQDLSTWSPLKGDFHAPKLFGKLTGINVDFRQFAFEFSEPRVAISGGGGADSALSLSTTIINGSPQGRKVVASAQIFGRTEGAVKAAPVEIAAGGKADVSFPPLSVPRNIRTVKVQMIVTDAETGAPYKIAVKELSAEYKPLTVDICQPVYRQCIYATQNVPQLVFRVAVAPDIAARAKAVTFRLLDEAGNVIREGNTTPAQLGADQKIEAGSLPVGRYTLAVNVAGKDAASLAQYQTSIRKLPPAKGNEVRVDEQRNLLVNGKPRVFIGWYGTVPTNDPRQDVVALQNLQTPVVLQGTDIGAVRSAWRDHGIYSIISIEPGRLQYTFDLWRDPKDTVASEHTKLPAPSDETRALVKRLVDAVRDEPGVLGYYLADEPEINNTRSDYLEAFYQMMQELDPYHPVMITNDTLDGIVSHGYRACDILAPDPYSPAWDYVPNFMKKVLEVGARGKATLVCPWQSSGQAHFTTDYGTDPPYPYPVMRNQYLAAIALGCRGFIGYTTPFFMPEPVLRYGLPPIWREVRFLESAMGAPAPAQALKLAADAEMAGWIRQTDGKLYLIVVNHKPGARKVTVSHPLLRGVASLDVEAEGRSVPVKGGSFTEDFAEGAARIYTTDPAGRKLAILSDVSKDIAAQEAACIKPGNLLHVSRGVRARASEGYYAPWFNQYYYYAINGITDDMGWTLSHTDKPAWLDLALPKEEKLGKVVIYSPNLEDYDLQFSAADGSVRLAEIRGCAQDVAEWSFQPPVPTLKLRVTARKARGKQNPQGATLAEIEAYATPGAGAPTPVRLARAVIEAPDFTAPAQETAGPPTLWNDDFRDFRAATKYNWDGHDDKWVLNPADLSATPKAGGGLILGSLAKGGQASMSHIFPYDNAYRYLQVSISSIEGEGYRWVDLMLGDSSGRPGYRCGVNTMKPGIYTVDSYYVHESYRSGTAKSCYTPLYVCGTAKADGAPSVRVTLDWVRLARRPLDGLTVTMANSSPLPGALKQGDELLYRVLLEEPAIDVTVEAMYDPSYLPLAINGEPYVQLARIGAKDGREWAALVRLGPGTGKADGAKGYPLCFRAVINGGAIKETYMNTDVKFE
jgi:hypothetical protein